MKNPFTKTVIPLIALGALSLACSDHHPGVPPHGEVGVAVAPSSIKGNTVANAGLSAPISGGPNKTGVTIPTTNGIIGRVQNGLQGRASPTSGNFARALTQVRGNLPKSTDVNKSAGFDQAQLLVYAACSDLTTGSTPIMKSQYNVDPNMSVTANQSALVAAGMTMLDQHAANLASQGPAASQLNTILTTLVQNQGTAGNSSTVVFMSVCIAANTAGAVMLGL